MTDTDISTAAAALGRKGGQSTSEAKQAASRANGKRGGRPRKSQGEIMDYVYGWYRYNDGKEIKFRYPARREDNLKHDGKRVTVEVTQGGNKWESRKGTVSWGGGNFVVTPA